MGNSDAPDVKLQITAEEQGVSSAVNNLAAEIRSLKETETEAAEGSEVLSNAFETLLEVMAVEKIVEFGKEIFNTVENIQKLSAVSGISTETLSVYSAAATQSGTSFEEMSGAITSVSKNVTLFEQGNQRAAKAIALTGLSIKDFTGLNSEQKIQLVVDAIAKMPPSLEKTQVQARLLGDSTGQLNKFLDTVAGEGFARVQEEAEKAGTIVGGDTVASFESLRKTVAEMKEVSEGIALQFESGLIPALNDTANAILKATAGDGVEGFKTFGQFAGDVIRDLVKLFALFFGGLEKAVNGPIDLIKNLGIAVEESTTLGPAQAAKNLVANQKESERTINAMVDAQLAAVQAELDGTTRIQQEALEKLKATQDKNNAKTGVTPANDQATKGLLKEQEQRDAAYKATLAAELKALQERDQIDKANQANRVETEKAGFDQGLTSLKDYFAQRRQEIETAGNQEITLLQDQRALEVANQARSQAEANSNSAKSRAAGGASTPVGQEFAASAARQQQEATRAAQAIGEIDTKITVAQIANKTKLIALDDDAFKTQQEQATKLAEFTKQINDIQGRTTLSAQAEAAAKAQEYRTLLQSQAGETPESIEAKVNEYIRLTTAQAAFADARKASETAAKELETEVAAIQLKVQQGLLFQIQADQQIRALENSRLPILQQLADEQTKAAAATGNDANREAAAANNAKLQQQKVQFDQAAGQAKDLRSAFEGSLNGAFTTFLTQGITSAKGVGAAFASLADTIISSLQKAAAQILVNIALQKLLGAAGGAAGGGGGLLSVLHLAEGGLVSGPGTSISDSVPAALSTGEYVMNAKAVEQIGVGALDIINHGLRSPAQARGGEPGHFAEGGLVGGGGNSGGGGKSVLHVGLEDGLVLRALKSPKAQKIVISHLAAAPKAANSALGRSKN